MLRLILFVYSFYLLLNHDDTLEATDLAAETDLETVVLATLVTLETTLTLGAAFGVDFGAVLVLAEDELETFELVFLELEELLDLFELELELDPPLEKGFTAGVLNIFLELDPPLELELEEAAGFGVKLFK